MENPKNPKIDEIEKDIIEENEDIIEEDIEDEDFIDKMGGDF